METPPSWGWLKATAQMNVLSDFKTPCIHSARLSCSGPHDSSIHCAARKASSACLRQMENYDWEAFFWLSEACILGADSWMKQTVNTHRTWRMWEAAGPTSTFFQILRTVQGQKPPPLVVLGAEHSLKEAPLSNHNSNTFLHLPGSEVRAF